MLRVQDIVRVMRMGPVRDTLAGLACEHRDMNECHPGCGHYSCPCGVSWDEGSEGPWEVHHSLVDE